MDDGNYVIRVYVDFKKAFDSVSHAILLQKLQHYGIRGLALNWFSSYLHDRKQFVSVNGATQIYKQYVHLVFLRNQSNSCKTRRNTAKDEQKYQPIFLLVFLGSRVTVSGILIHKD